MCYFDAGMLMLLLSEMVVLYCIVAENVDALRLAFMLLEVLMLLKSLLLQLLHT